jgi:hypothetical protein
MEAGSMTGPTCLVERTESGGVRDGNNSPCNQVRPLRTFFSASFNGLTGIRLGPQICEATRRGREGGRQHDNEDSAARRCELHPGREGGREKKGQEERQTNSVDARQGGSARRRSSSTFRENSADWHDRHARRGRDEGNRQSISQHFHEHFQGQREEREREHREKQRRQHTSSPPSTRARAKIDPSLRTYSWNPSEAAHAQIGPPEREGGRRGVDRSVLKRRGSEHTAFARSGPAGLNQLEPRSTTASAPKLWTEPPQGSREREGGRPGAGRGVMNRRGDHTAFGGSGPATYHHACRGTADVPRRRHNRRHKWSIPVISRNDLQVGNKCGEGAYGGVYGARLCGHSEPVAVKVTYASQILINVYVYVCLYTQHILYTHTHTHTGGVPRSGPEPACVCQIWGSQGFLCAGFPARNRNDGAGRESLCGKK